MTTKIGNLTIHQFRQLQKHLEEVEVPARYGMLGTMLFQMQEADKKAESAPSDNDLPLED